jgi:hypothetical protein
MQFTKTGPTHTHARPNLYDTAFARRIIIVWINICVAMREWLWTTARMNAVFVVATKFVCWSSQNQVLQVMAKANVNRRAHWWEMCIKMPTLSNKVSGTVMVGRRRADDTNSDGVGGSGQDWVEFLALFL